MTPLTSPTTAPLTDAEKLQVLAAWFDMWDKTPYERRDPLLDEMRGSDEVQRDLRRIAANLEAVRDYREALKFLITARDESLDAMNGLGHPGEPHDEYMRKFGSPDDPPSRDDCSRCAGAQYGTDDQMNRALDEARALLTASAEEKP